MCVSCLLTWCFILYSSYGSVMANAYTYRKHHHSVIKHNHPVGKLNATASNQQYHQLEYQRLPNANIINHYQVQTHTHILLIIITTYTTKGGKTKETEEQKQIQVPKTTTFHKEQQLSSTHCGGGGGGGVL